MKPKKTGQSSVEFIMIIAVAMAMLLPASYVFLTYTDASTGQVASEQINQIGNRIIDKSEEMYGLGHNSWTTMDIRLPERVEEAYIADNSELYITYQSDRGLSTAVFFSTRFPIIKKNADGTLENCYEPCNLNLSSGYNEIRIRSQGENVSIKVE